MTEGYSSGDYILLHTTYLKSIKKSHNINNTTKNINKKKRRVDIIIYIESNNIIIYNKIL